MRATLCATMCAPAVVTCLSWRRRFPSDTDPLPHWDDVVFVRETVSRRLREFFSTRGMKATESIVDSMRNLRRSTLEHACRSALQQNVLSVAFSYREALKAVNQVGSASLLLTQQVQAMCEA